MRIAVIALSIALSGCASKTPEERAAFRQARQAEEQRQVAAQREAYRQNVYSQCRSYGFRDGSAEFNNCVMRVDMSNREQDAATRQMILQQAIQAEQVRQQRALPLCSSMGPGMAGYMRAEGSCR